MKLLKFAFAGTALILAACSTVSVTTDYDHSASFTGYRTYSLAPAAKGETLSPTVENALRETLRQEFAARGVRETTKSKGDLAVVRHVFVQQKVSVQQYNDWGYSYPGAWPYGYGRYGMWSGAPYTYTDVFQYTEGTMILDFVDTRTSKLVFRGTGTAVVGGPESNTEKMRNAVKKIMEKYPVPAPKH